MGTLPIQKWKPIISCLPPIDTQVEEIYLCALANKTVVPLHWTCCLTGEGNLVCTWTDCRDGAEIDEAVVCWMEMPKHPWGDREDSK